MDLSPRMTGRGFPGFLTPEDIGLPPLADEETFRQHLELTLRDIQSQMRAALTKAQQSVEFIEGIQSDDIIIERDPVTGQSRWSLAEGVAQQIVEAAANAVPSYPFTVTIDAEDDIQVEAGRVVIWRAHSLQFKVLTPVGAYTPIDASALSGAYTIYLNVNLYSDWPTSDLPSAQVLGAASGPTALIEGGHVGMIDASSVTTTSSIRIPLASWTDISARSGFVQHQVGDVWLLR